MRVEVAPGMRRRRFVELPNARNGALGRRAGIVAVYINLPRETRRPHNSYRKLAELMIGSFMRKYTGDGSTRVDMLRFT